MKILLLLLHIALAIWQAAAFSPPIISHTLPSSLHAYHFGQSASKPISKQQVQSKRPTSYVPTGLTEEQYAQIKLEDAAKLSGDLGAWGPRWKKISGDPQGNWFSMPGLWTGGYSREAVGEKLPKWMLGDEENVGRSRRILIGCLLGLRRYGLAYLMIVASLSYSMVLKQVTVRSVAMKAVLALLALKPIDAIVRRTSSRYAMLKEFGVTKLAAILAVLVSLMSLVVRR